MYNKKKGDFWKKHLLLVQKWLQVIFLIFENDFRTSPNNNFF